MHSGMVPLGSPAPDFNLKSVDEKFYNLHSFVDKEVLVIIFMCNHCPYVQKIWGELVAIANRSSKSVQFLGINSNGSNPNYPEDSFANMKIYAQKKSQSFPYLLDENQEVGKAYGAVCTPDFFVYDKDRTLAYRGAFEGIESAINAILKGEDLPKEQQSSMGCSIKWNITA